MTVGHGDHRSGVSRVGDPRAFSFGSTASQYEARRPGYPASAVDWLLAPVTPPAVVADVGAGTGKLSRIVADAGHRVVAVEPDPGMLADLRRAVPGVDAVEGRAESLPVPDASLDAVLVAQAWHWMDHGRAAAEFARVLRPGGLAGLVWNVPDTSDDLANALTDLTSAIDLADADEGQGLVLPHPDFAPGEVMTVDNPHDYSVSDLVELVATWSYVARGPDPQGVLARVRELAERHADPSGTVTYRLRTRCHRFLRR